MSTTVLTHGTVTLVKPSRSWALVEDHAPRQFLPDAKGVITLPLGRENRQVTGDGVEAFSAKRVGGRHEVIMLLVKDTAMFSGGGAKALKLDAGEYYIGMEQGEGKE